MVATFAFEQMTLTKLIPEEVSENPSDATIL